MSAGGRRDAWGPRTNAQPPGRRGGTWGKHAAAAPGPSEWRGDPAFSSGRGGAAFDRAGGHAPAPGAEGGPTASPSGPAPARPSPRALADLAGAGALHSEARGGAGPPHTAALRHEPPPPARDPGQGRGAHFLYLAGLDPILSRGGLQSPPPPPTYLPGPVGSGLGSSFLSPARLSLSFPLPSFVCLCPSPLVSPFSVPSSCLFFPCPSLFCPVSLTPDFLSPLPILRGRSHWKDQTLSSLP